MKAELIEDDMITVTGDDGTVHYIPLDAIATWGELLGITDTTKVVEAIVQVRSNRSDPGVIDKATSRNAWTSAYEQAEKDALSDLNQTRRAALHPVLKASGALAADGRAETRRLLGLETGEAAAVALSDETAVALSDEAGTQPTASTQADDGGLSSILSDPTVLQRISDARSAFVRAITPPLPIQDDQKRE